MKANIQIILLAILLLILNACGGDNSDNPPDGGNEPGSETGTMELDDVQFWAYQIQGFSHDGSVDAIVDTHYDMIVLDVTNSDRDENEFDMHGAMQRVANSPASQTDRSKLLIAYIDVGEAEDWRIYWDEANWIAPTNTMPGTPDFMVRPDPDGWEGNYPVAFWDPEWKNIMIHNDDSMLNLAIDVGFKGIYMDWIEAYSDAGIEARAAADGVNPADEMVKFICEIREEARKRVPDFYVIQQNAPDLIDDVTDPAAYLACIDAIAQEQVYYDGGPTDDWNDTDGCDDKVPETGHGYSAEWYQEQLGKYQSADKLVFTVDYACDPDNVDLAYTRSLQQGYLPYVTRRSLSELTETPPPGY